MADIYLGVCGLIEMTAYNNYEDLKIFWDGRRELELLIGVSSRKIQMAAKTWLFENLNHI